MSKNVDAKQMDGEQSNI